jgi:hypothetical protein
VRSDLSYSEVVFPFHHLDEQWYSEGAETAEELCYFLQSGRVL